MPLIHITGEFIDLECDTPFCFDFPDLLIAESTDDGIVYFDATAYLEAKENKSLSVDGFFFNFNYLHIALTKTLSLDPKKSVRVNRKNHILIDARYAFLFISYVSPDFIGYINDRLVDLFMDGIAFSDTYLSNKTREQLPNEVIEFLARYGRDEGKVGDRKEDGSDLPTEAGADV